MLRLCLVLCITFVLTACGSDEDEKEYSSPVTLKGAVVDGLVTNMPIFVYAYKDGDLGEVITQGSTDSKGNITDIILNPLGAPYILIATADANTTEVIGNGAPVIAVLKMIVTAAQLRNINHQPIYLTPLTTIAADIALYQADAATTPTEFQNLANVAANQTTSALGFGLLPTIDIFTTPPIITETLDEISLDSTIAYRAAIESFIDIVETVALENPSFPTKDIMSGIAVDLADGEINGHIGKPDLLNSIGYLENSNMALLVETIPAVQQSDIESLLGDEALATNIINTNILDGSGLKPVSAIIPISSGHAISDADRDLVDDVDDHCFTADRNLSIDADADGCDDKNEDKNGACHQRQLIILAPFVDLFIAVADPENYKEQFSDTGSRFTAQNNEDFTKLSKKQKQVIYRYLKTLPPNDGTIGSVTDELGRDPHKFFTEDLMIGSENFPLQSNIEKALKLGGVDFFIKQYGYSLETHVEGCGVED